MDNIEKQMLEFYHTLKEVNERRTEEFSGLGLLLYDENLFPKDCHTDLRPSANPPKDIKLGTEECINILVTFSKKSHILHDGFHLFNQDGILTHVAQYFVPPIAPDIIPNESYGTRYRSAQYGSFMKGVIIIGTVNHDGRFYCFKEGKLYFPSTVDIEV